MTTAPELTPSPTPAATSVVGTVVSGRYRIRELLGEGGMGAVYLAEHTHMRKRVALKLLHAEMSKDEEVLARFKREAEAAAHVEHPNVAAATDFGQTEDGAFFLVLEYVEGKSLRTAIDKGPLAFGRALHIVRQMALALERAHTAGIVHRDLKPENVMLVQKGDDPDFVKVLDFGIAKIEPSPTRDATQPLTRFGTILGTPEYMAPEQALGETVGPSADLYAVGIMLYEMLTGKHPFDANDRMAVLSMHIVAPVPMMADRNAAVDIPKPLEDLVRRLLEKDSKARPANARALVEELDAAAAQAGVELPNPVSARSFGRESNPGLSPPAPPSSTPNIAAAAPPQSSRAPESNWNPSDALAKTDYGLAAPEPNIPTAKPERPGFATALSEAPYPFEKVALPKVLLPLKKLHRNVVLAIAAGIPVLVLIIIVIAILSSRSSSESTSSDVDGGPGGGGGSAKGGQKAQAEKQTKASPERLKAATTKGVTALEGLAAEFPEDANVHAQLALSLYANGRMGDALNILKTAAKLDMNVIDDACLQIPIALAQRTDTSEDAFTLMETGLGAKGVDALLDLSNLKTAAPQVRARANKSLNKADVRAAASSSTLVILDLKNATGCPGKRDVLERVKESGDARILPTLKGMKNPRGCGFMGMRDCYSCLRRDDLLDDTIRAVESRAGTTPSK